MSGQSEYDQHVVLTYLGRWVMYHETFRNRAAAIRLAKDIDKDVDIIILRVSDIAEWFLEERKGAPS